MVQQSLLAANADTLDFIEREARQCLRPLGAVRGDSKPMRFVAQTLQEIEDRVALDRARTALAPAQRSVPARHCAPVLSRSRRLRPRRCSSSSQDAAADIELPLPAIDQDQIGPGAPVAFGFLFDGASETAHQNLAHHRIVIAARGPVTRIAAPHLTPSPSGLGPSPALWERVRAG